MTDKKSPLTEAREEAFDTAEMEGELAEALADALGEAILAQRLILREIEDGSGRPPRGAFSSTDLSKLLTPPASEDSGAEDGAAAEGSQSPPSDSTGGGGGDDDGGADDGSADDGGEEDEGDAEQDAGAGEKESPEEEDEDADGEDAPRPTSRRLKLPVVPLRNSILFPQQVIPLAVGRQRSVRAVETAMDARRRVLVVSQVDSRTDRPGPSDIYRWGTVAHILKVFEMPDGTRNIIVQGTARARLLELTQLDPHTVGVIETHYDEVEETIETEAIVANLRSTFEQIADLAPYLTPDHQAMISSVSEAGHMADAVVSVLNVSVKEKQEILETPDVNARLQRAMVIAAKELQKLEIGSRIQTEVQGEISKSQRDYFLREQMKAIQRELGDGEDASDESKELRARIAKSKMPADVKAAANKELDRLSRIHPGSPEYTVSRTYLDVMLDLPWRKHSRDRLDIAVARDILDGDHHGLEKVKKRILEFLAVRKLKKDMRGPILCFVGPPGVGKTSLGRSIASALKRKFFRMSLGGLRDEAEIRGHRRTYIGAMPGRIIQGLKRSGTANPVFMLDEIDKLGSDFRGDPSSALLEVLDPEQNHTFSDHYLDQPFDLSKVLFIATANILDTVPPALRDRMEIIEVPGYTLLDKLKIAQRFLVPKQIEENGLNGNQIEFSEEALVAIIESHTREAGVRNLERRIGAVCRGVARAIAEETTRREKIEEPDLATYLGQPRFFPEQAERFDRPGIATGLAWTPTGGDLLFLESTRMAGSGKTMLSGRLGDVMKESANAALSYIRSRAKDLAIDEDLHEKWDVHVHVPAGSIPKDGPSAGVAIYSSLMSLVTQRSIRHDTAMTGEITLRGVVLPVGGIKEKLLAAHRAGIKRVLLPERNRRDLEEIPKEVRDELELLFISHLDEVLPLVIQERASIAKPKKKRKNAPPRPRAAVAAD